MQHNSEKGISFSTRLAMLRAAVCGAGTAAGFVLQTAAGGSLTAPALAAYLIALLSGSYDAAVDTVVLFRNRGKLDVHFLMLAVAAGAASIGHWWEGSVLMFLFSTSSALEDYAQERTERGIHALFKVSPKEATRILDSGKESRVVVESLEPGMIVRLRPGELVPVDADVIEGRSAADESTLTGESIPAEKAPGDRVLAGTLNMWGRLDCRVEKPVSESALAKVIRLIKEAQESKAPAQRFTDKFGGSYTYIILALCTAMFFVWWKVLQIPPRAAFYRTMTLLVVSSPCALVLSIPSAILAGIAAGARRGILFRGGVAIEKLAEVDRVALDKTGTLTTGHLSVLRVESVPAGNEKDILLSAAALAQDSNHPVSQAIVREARSRGVRLPEIRQFQSHSGQGLTGVMVLENPVACRLGRRTMFDGADWLHQLPLPEPGITETVIETSSGRGRILLRDEVRTASRPLIEALHRHGLKLTMLSGDRPEAAAAVAKAVGVEDVRSGLNPEGKVAQIKEWTSQGEHVAMVGDGINDAPSLAAAYVGVAMGMRGSDAALEQADIVLMQDRLDRFYFAHQLSVRASRIIRQNLTVSLGSVVILMTAAFSGLIPLTVGVIGHEGSTVVVVLNSLRLLLFDIPAATEES